MKPFQNPYVVGGLALCALALVSRNALVPLWGRVFQRATPVQTTDAVPVSATPAPVATPTLEAAAPKPPRVIPDSNIDLTQVGWKLNSSPHRDPFQINPATI